MNVKSGNPVLIIPKGKIDSTSFPILKEELQLLYEQGFNIITLDFSLVTGIDNTGLEKLLIFQRKLEERGGGLRIINITDEYTSKIFKAIRLYKVINIEDELFQSESCKKFCSRQDK